MIKKRFDIFTVKDYKRVIGRMKELILEGKVDSIKEEFGEYTNSVWEESGDFLCASNNSHFEENGLLDVIEISDFRTSNKDALLFIQGDIEKGKTMISYLVRNDSCDVFVASEHSNVEDLVKQLNKEYEALSFFNDLFTKIDDLIDEQNQELLDLNDEYDEEINADFFFENFAQLLDAYLCPEHLNPKFKYLKVLIDELVKITKIR